jgi:hypothetical protein
MGGPKLSAALCAFLLLLVAGCGGGASSSSTETSRQGAQESPAESRSSSGEASIEDFGQKAQGAERQAILAVFDGYLGALAHKNYAGACAQMAAALHESLGQFSGKRSKANCAALLPGLLSPQAPANARSQAAGEVTGVRVEGERGFVVFKAPAARLYYMSMVEEDGKWKVASAVAGVLAPEL